MRRGVSDAGGYGARYFCTDMCDGESQGTDGINYSLASREMIANMIEIQAGATPFDGGVFLASCDKGLPGNLMGLARLNIPAIVVPGGVMSAGPDMLTLEQLGAYSARFERGEIDEETLEWAKCNACPSCGACSFIGTASTMQIMAEALGLTLPGSSLLPATSPDLSEYAYRAGKRAVELALSGLRPRDIVTMDSGENAILIHAAVSGSTNTLLHLPAICHELGLNIDGDTFDRLHRGARYLLDIRPAGRWPAEFFYYAGGVPRIMEELRGVLHLSVMTVTGKTLGENLDELRQSGFYERCEEWLRKANEKYGLSLRREDIIRPFDDPIGTDGSIAVLRGNLAPEGAVIKHTACPKEMFHAVLRARPFDSEEACLDAVLRHKVQKGDAVFIRYEGPKGSGMPEMFYTSEAISSDAVLGRAIALITDGRFSGASTGPVIGHCSPEPGGPVRRAHRPGGGGRFDRDRRAQPEAGHRRHRRGTEIRRGNCRRAGRAQKSLAAQAQKIPVRRPPPVQRTRRRPHERRLSGIYLKFVIWTKQGASSAPCTPEPEGFTLWTPIAETACQDKSAWFPLKLSRNKQTHDVMLLARRRSRLPGRFASGESLGIIPGGKASFPQGIFPAFLGQKPLTSVSQDRLA